MQLLSQVDSRWRNAQLGLSKYTIGSAGCAVTCLAMLSGHDPLQVNQLLRDHGGFLNGLLVKWLNAAQILGLPYDPTVDEHKFFPCMAETWLDNAHTKQHFFVVLGNGQILDPADGRMKANPYRIFSFRNIGSKTATTPPPPPPPPSDWPRTITVKSRCNVRSAPATNAPLAGSRQLNAGDKFTGVALVDGTSVGSNNKWVKSQRGNYVWSGNLSW